MSLKRVLSYMTAAGTVVSVFGGMQIGASTAADSVTFRDRDASEQTVLNSTWTSYDADGDNIMDVVFDDASDTITFNSDIYIQCHKLKVWTSATTICEIRTPVFCRI